jgi:hypothetical protein
MVEHVFEDKGFEKADWCECHDHCWEVERHEVIE